MYDIVNKAKQAEQQAILYALQSVVNRLVPQDMSWRDLFQKAEPDAQARRSILEHALEREQKRKVAGGTTTGVHLSAHFETSYATFTLHLLKIIDLLQHAKEVKHILFEIRAAAATPAYQFLKREEAHPAVCLLHTLCLASYIDVELLAAYSMIGEAIYEATGEKETLYKTLIASMPAAVHAGLIQNDASFSYIKSYSRYLLGALKSRRIGSFLKLLGLGEYDPRGELANNAGMLFEEEITPSHAHEKIVVRTIYTPSPTIGDAVSPEARCFLQALENRHFLSPDVLKNDPYPFSCWFYVNLQNITSKHEGKRSRALMQLNCEYPFSFYGITVSQDSSFYRGGIVSKDVKKFTKALVAEEPLNTHYRQAMLDELCAEDNFTTANRGYYFPGSSTTWKSAFQAIVDDAFHVAIAVSRPEGMIEARWNWQQKAAFRELVAIGIMRYAQLQVAKRGSIVTTYACKESIDRGGKINACMLWALAKEPTKVEKQVFHVLHARALLGRFRLILAMRAQPLFALMNTLKQETVHAFLQRRAA